MSSAQDLLSFLSSKSYGMSAVHKQVLPYDGRSIANKNSESYDFYPMSESYDESFSIGSKVWVYVGANIKSWLPGIVTGEIPPRFFNNIEIYPRSYTITVLPSKIAIHLSQHGLTEHLRKINGAPEEAVYVPQYGDVKPHCGRSLMLLILEGLYNMEELRLLSRGFNRALNEMGFDLRVLNFNSKSGVNKQVAYGADAAFSALNLGNSDSMTYFADTKRDEYNSIEIALKRIRINNDEDIMMDYAITA